MPHNRLIKDQLLKIAENSFKYFQIIRQSMHPRSYLTHYYKPEYNNPSSTASMPTTKTSFLKKSIFSDSIVILQRVVFFDLQLLFSINNSGEQQYPPIRCKGELEAKEGSISFTVPCCDITISLALMHPCPTDLVQRQCKALITLTRIFSSSSKVNLEFDFLRASSQSSRVCVEYSVKTAMESAEIWQQSIIDSRCS